MNEQALWFIAGCFIGHVFMLVFFSFRPPWRNP